MRERFYVTISRDPFARQDTVRECVPKDYRQSCAWCGNDPGKFRYGTEPDGLAPGRVNWHRGEFCSKGCHDSYHAY